MWNSTALAIRTHAVPQIQERLYKVHRHFFETYSAVFKTMFSLPTAAGELPEGDSEQNPIILEGVKPEEFECFLSVIYPSYVYKLGKGRTQTGDMFKFIATETFLRVIIKQWRIGQPYFLWHRDGNLCPCANSQSIDSQESLLQLRG